MSCKYAPVRYPDTFTWSLCYLSNLSFTQKLFLKVFTEHIHTVLELLMNLNEENSLTVDNQRFSQTKRRNLAEILCMSFNLYSQAIQDQDVIIQNKPVHLFCPKIAYLPSFFFFFRCSKGKQANEFSWFGLTVRLHY